MILVSHIAIMSMFFSATQEMLKNMYLYGIGIVIYFCEALPGITTAHSKLKTIICVVVLGRDVIFFYTFALVRKGR